MAHSYVSSLFHCAFSTKERRPTIHEEFRERLWAYMGGIARKNKMKALAVGGIADHAHILLSLPSKMDIAKTVQLIKGGSSKWVQEEFPAHRHFSWQEGYGAFSIGISQVDPTVDYIQKQPEHHRRQTYQEEFIAILEKHWIAYDLKEVWG